MKAILKVFRIATTVFKGTDGIKAGTAGLVPPPEPEDEGKVLGANGKWVTGSAANNIIFEDEKTLEEKLGAINGITSDLNCEDESIAASAAALKEVNDSLSKKFNKQVAFSGTDASGTAYFVRMGKQVVMSFTLSYPQTSNPASWYVLLKMPDGYRPDGSYFGGAGTVDGATYMGITINNVNMSGWIKQNTRYSNIYGTISYFTNDDFPQ